MMIPEQSNIGDRRVAILTPTGKDATLTATMFADAGIESLICHDMACVAGAVRDGIGILLIAEEALAGGAFQALSEILAQQPPWSDVPVLLLSRYGADSSTVDTALQSLSNVTLLERPVRPATLISAVRSSLKARERQYQVGEYLAEQASTNAQLQASIRERERVEDALRDADRRKNEFIATLAHELRNPLAPIRNSLYILRMANNSDPATEQVCEMMDRQVNHLVRLVDDLMEVSRITRGKVELRLEPVELSSIIRSAVEASRPLIEACNHQLAISIPPTALVVYGDQVRLAQVVSNLLNNAAKYMNPGGQIWISTRQQEGQALISVRDSGVGIAAEMLPRIFEMFTQVDRSARQAQGGLGIGLTLVRSLVQMHGGEVEAKSAGIDQGSEFIVRLPLHQATTRPAPTAPEGGASLSPQHRVLVVDDNRDAAKSLGLLLKLLGADVHVVNDGPAALEALRSCRPTIVLLDIGMPGMDGYEVAQRMRRLPEGRDVMLIALTGWGQEEDRRRTTQAGFDHHLLKPADVSALKTLFMSQPSPTKPS